MLLSSFAIIITKQLISSVTWPSTGSKPLPIAGPLWPSCTVKGSDKTPHRTAPTVRLTFNSNPNPNPSRPVRSGAFTVRGIWRFKVGHWPTHARQKKIEKKHSDVDKNTKKTEEEEKRRRRRRKNKRRHWGEETGKEKNKEKRQLFFSEMYLKCHQKHLKRSVILHSIPVRRRRHIERRSVQSRQRRRSIWREQVWLIAGSHRRW